MKVTTMMFPLHYILSLNVLPTACASYILAFRRIAILIFSKSMTMEGRFWPEVRSLKMY